MAQQEREKIISLCFNIANYSVVRKLLLAMFVLTVFCCCLSKAFSAEPHPVWYGSVTFKYQWSGHLDKERKTDQFTMRQYYDEYVDFSVTVAACGTSAQKLRIKEARADYSRYDEYSKENSQEKCYISPEAHLNSPDKRPGKHPGGKRSGNKDKIEIIKPGNKEHVYLKWGGIVHPDFLKNRSKGILSFNAKNKTYTLSAGLSDYPAIYCFGSMQSDQYDACAAETHTTDINYVMKKVNTASKCGESKNCQFTVQGVERILPLIVFHSGAYHGEKQITDSVSYPDAKAMKIIHDKSMKWVEDFIETLAQIGQSSPELQSQIAELQAKIKQAQRQNVQKEGNDGPIPGDEGNDLPTPGKDPETTFHESLNVFWEFKRKDLCDLTAEQIEEDLAYAEAYADKKTREKPFDQYKCYVDRWAIERWTGTPPDNLDCEKSSTSGHPGNKDGGDSAKGPDIEIGVNKNCKIPEGMEAKYRKDQKHSCIPEEVTEATIRHEMKHIEQCQKNQTRFNADNTEFWGDREVEAHLVGIAALLDVLKKNCPERDRSSYDKRINRLQH